MGSPFSSLLSSISIFFPSCVTVTLDNMRFPLSIYLCSLFILLASASGPSTTAPTASSVHRMMGQSRTADPEAQHRESLDIPLADSESRPVTFGQVSSDVASFMRDHVPYAARKFYKFRKPRATEDEYRRSRTYRMFSEETFDDLRESVHKVAHDESVQRYLDEQNIPEGLRRRILKLILTLDMLMHTPSAQKGQSAVMRRFGSRGRFSRADAATAA
jgi:hypothetical protein